MPFQIYKKAANKAPKKPRAAPPAFMCAAAPVLVDLAVPVAVPDPLPADPAAPLAPVPVAAAVDALMIDVMEPEKETVTVVLPKGTVFRPVLRRPAGKEAGSFWVVTTAGCVVMATAAVG
jgi:hypothetical protein